MAFSDAGNNAMLNALGALMTHVGLLTAGAAKTGTTGVASTDVLTKATHGLVDGDVIVFTSLTGGTGLKTLKPYYVRDMSGDTFKLAGLSGGAALDFTTDISDATFVELTEISGGSPAYARVAIAFASAALGILDDSTNGAAFDVPAGGVVNYVGFFSASTGGTLYAVDDLTQETFTGQGVYTLTDAKLNLNA